ncbi:MAG: peptidase [Parcubacteria group bacterium]|nr:peptidase [Parcubacteria group bacterium]
MIFPALQGKVFGYVNLNLEAQEWISRQAEKTEENALLDPVICEQMVTSVHDKYDLDFSYGGWMEDRSFLWRGSYLEEEKFFTHLGVDLNVASGTEVTCDFEAEVVKLDNDYPEVGGWGTRIILKHAALPLYMIYAHLDPDVAVKVGDKLIQDQIFAKVGRAPYNGNWFPHLHVQTISEEYYKKISEGDKWDELDGYGSANEVTLHSKRFRDPMEFISLI